jgi:hypothetical protein
LKKILLLTFFVFTIFKIFSIEKIDAAFVSNISTVNSDGKVLITWQNPVNFTDYVTIYRSNEIIDSEEKLLKAAKLETLKNKEEKYIDSAPAGNNFYAILITLKNTEKNNIIFIPFRNFSSKPVIITKEELSHINKFSAKSSSFSITLEWDYIAGSSNNSKIVLYRNTEPISDENKLSNSIKIATSNIDSKYFVDIPMSGIFYYYAIFVENDIEKTFVPNVSISTNPVFIQKKVETVNDFSTDNFIPLPLITLANDPKSGKNFIDPQILKNPKKIDYNSSVSTIMKKYRADFSKIKDDYTKDTEEKIKRLDFHFLNDEEIFNAKDYALEYGKIMTYLKNKDYDNAEKYLTDILIETIPDYLLRRVSYYLGQIYYANGDYYKSYQYMILAYDDYRKEILPFVNSIYYNVFKNLER